MQNTRFVVLTGHLSNYPLSDLIGILRHQRKSGRLTIEYALGPASFFFQDGELVDAKLNQLSGLQAICVAVAQPEAAFNFNPLIKPPRRSIEKEHQRVVSELFGCWDESFTQVEATPSVERLPPAPESASETPKILEPVKHEPLALMAAPQPARSYSLLLGIAAGLILVGLSTGIAVTGGFSRKDALAGPGEARQVPAELESSKSTQSGKSEVGSKSNRPRRQDTRSSATKNNVASENQPLIDAKTTSSKDDSILQSVNVVMQVENGRVVKASVANPRPGMDSYEALALRMARQRRFSDKTNGEQSVRINVSKKD
jgi:hypothetical protein